MSRLPAKRDYSAVLKHVSDGKSITEACKLGAMDATTFYKDRKRHPDLEAAFQTAHEIGAEMLADTLLNIDQRVRNPLMARVVSDNVKWLLSKRASARFGDQIGQKDNGNNDLTAILREAIARIPRPSRDLDDSIDAENVTISSILGDESA